MVPHPVSPYGASKLSGEGYCSAYYRTFGIETVALRFGNVYGPRSGHKNSVVARFIKRASSGETLEIYGDGTQTRDFIYVGDLIRAVRGEVRRNYADTSKAERLLGWRAEVDLDEGLHRTVDWFMGSSDPRGL